MFANLRSEKPPRPGENGLSFVSAEAVVSGDMTSAARIQIEGRIDGNVRCAMLGQSESGVIAGDIVADEVRIAGLVQGAVKASTVIIEASARVTGDVTYETISIAPGAGIEGRLARREVIADSAGEPTFLIASPAAGNERAGNRKRSSS